MIAEFVSYISAHSEDVLKWFIAIGGILATLATALSKILYRFRSAVEITKDESALVDFALKMESGDVVYQKFLRDIIKEKTVSALFNVPIRIGKIGALMELYNRGEATLSDIRRALPYMTFTASGVLILNDLWDIVLLWVSRICLLFGFGITLLGCLAIPFSHGIATVQLLLSVLTYFLFILIVAMSSQGLFIASRLKALQ